MKTQNAAPHVISGLSRKKEELLEKIEHRRLELRQMERLVDALDLSMLAMDPEYDPGAIKPKRTNNRVFGRGELKSLVIGVLKDAGEPLTNRQIADEVQKRKGLEEDCLKAVKYGLRGYTFVEKVINNGQKCWRMMPYQAAKEDPAKPPLRVL